MLLCARESTIVGETPKCDALVSRLTRAILDRRLVEHLREFGVEYGLRSNEFTDDSSGS